LTWLDLFIESWDTVTAWLAATDLIITTAAILWILSIKKESTAAVAWCLTVILVPILGSILFFIFGYQNVHKPLTRKRRHKHRFRQSHATTREEGAGEPPREGEPAPPPEPEDGWEGMARLARRLDAFPLTGGNGVEFYHEGESAYAAMTAAIQSAKHHIHLETFILQPDATGERFRSLLAEKAKQGVEVRLLYDALGSHKIRRSWLRPLLAAGAKTGSFLPVSILRRKFQINLRNHRKIMVVDGRAAFTGGLNIGDEYLGKVAKFGFWRDTHLKLEGPGVGSLQQVFAEDWNFATGEAVDGPAYFPANPGTGDVPAQVVQSGPDQELKSIREVYFAAILRARKHVWIASPYFVPDAGMHDALALAGRSGIDVRLLCPFHPDKWIPFLAARYYWTDMLEAGVKVYQYTKGFLHAKLMLVDGEWASVGTANMDNRSLHLNFEVNCLIYSPKAVAELEAVYERDLSQSIRLNRDVYAKRPFTSRLAENACRLLSPIL
jgi:cardiolipin synthase